LGQRKEKNEDELHTAMLYDVSSLHKVQKIHTG